MTLLTVVQDVCAVVGVSRPTSVFASIDANRTMQEMVALANEMAQRIAYNSRDWTILRDISISGTVGPGAVFNFPANFKRMLLTTNIWRSTNTTTPMRFIADSDEWISRRARGVSESPGEWTILAGQLFIHPGLTGYVPGDIPEHDIQPEMATYIYLTNGIIKLASGGVGERFTADGDSYRLDERLLKLGMIWQWKAQKGSPYAEDLGTYGDALTIAMGTDSPAPIIIGRGGNSNWRTTNSGQFV